jgi:hypothetical protein
MKSHRFVTVAGTILFGALLLGAPNAAAAPAEPTGIAVPAYSADPPARPVGQPRSAPVAIPTPTRIDTGEGPGEEVDWWLIAVPALVLLGLAAWGSYAWIARSERSPR